MISSETPYKLREIIQDTWPQLYYLKGIKKEDTEEQNHGDTSKKNYKKWR